MMLVKKDIISQYEIFSALTDVEMNFLVNRARELKINRFEYIYRQKDTATSIYVLFEGSIKLAKFSADGREAIKEVIHSPNIFGFSVFQNEGERHDFAQALDNDVKILEISNDHIKEVMKLNHGFCLKIISMLTHKLTRRENRLASIMMYDARGRIIDFIKKSANENGRKVGLETLIKHSLTQQDIANMTGTSRQTVTHVLNDLKKSNLIHFSRKSILVRDIERLA